MVYVSLLSKCLVFLQFLVYLADVGSQICGTGYQRLCGDVQVKMRMKPFVGREGALLGGAMCGIIICKFSIGKQGNPVGLVIVQKAVKLLLKNLVDPFVLPIGVQVACR